MRTALVSDLHLGSIGGNDIVREPERRERLVAALEEADRVVLLGDALELRQRPVAAVLEIARPLFEALGRALAGRRLVLVPGNHDHGLAGPWLERLRLDGAQPAADAEWAVGADDGPAGRLAAAMPDVEVTLAYPGLVLRPGVYATHGHYLDLHLTVPRLESIAASAMGRLTGRGRDVRTAADYEAVLGPMYAFYGSLAEGAAPNALARGGLLSREVWARVNGDSRAASFLIGRVTIPGAVAALNGLGLGPFSPVLTGEELRRSGLAAMGHVADKIAPPGTTDVIFGHTHRTGPLPADDPGDWTSPGGIRLWNSGCWFHETAFVTDRDTGNPYWPGTVLVLDDEGPPERRNVLPD
jgi:hypothetical protein